MAEQKFKEGTKVWYSSRDGKKYPGVIEGYDEDGKNGKATYDVTLENGDMHWGYENQFTKRS
jgi:hypothetical protein